jgi:phasin
MARDQHSSYDIPEDMRNFAVRSVAQARKAFDSFIGASHKAVDTAQDSTHAVQSNLTEVTKKTIAYAEQNIAAAFDLAQKLVNVRDASEVLQHISEYQRNQVASLQAQMRDVGSVVQKGATEAASQIQRSAVEASATLRSAAGETAEAMQNVVVEAAKRKTA